MAACLGAPTFSVSNEGVSRRWQERASLLPSLRRGGRRPARGPPVTPAAAAAAQPLLVSIRDSDLLNHPAPMRMTPGASPFPISSHSSSSSSNYSCATTATSTGGGTATSVKVKSAVDDDDVGDDDLNDAIKKGRNILAAQQDILQRIIKLRTSGSSVEENVVNMETEASLGTDRGQKEKIPLWRPQIGTSAANALSLNKETESAITKGKILSTSLPFTAGSPDEKLPEVSEEDTVDVNVPQDVDTDAENASYPPLAGPNVMNVILVAAECAPWSKTGGLGDVAGALPKALAKRGHRVMVVAPRYANYSEPQEVGVHKRYRICGQDMEVTYFHAYIDGVDFVFINSHIFSHCQNDIYGGERQDILKRMVLLCKSAVEVPWHVPCGGVCYGDGNLVFIANDWHTALLPVYLRACYRDNGLMKYTRSVLVIHNIAHQGRGPMDDFWFTDLPQHYGDIFKVYDPVGGEHFNIFAAGLRTTDQIVTVSHGYTWELKTSEGGWGLHEVINENDWKLQGIVNGIDTNDWNPELDVHLKADGYINYTFDTLKTGKSQCKAALQKEFGLPVRDQVPFIAFIGRLDHQKGIDIIAEAIPWMVGQDTQLVMLGTGRRDLEEMLRKFEKQHFDKVRGWVGFSVKVAHRIIAGADILLMPSRFEPCGLNQLYAMKYGTIPVVHAVGGLRDTVKQFDPFKETGFGWTFDRAEPQKLINALGHCLNTYWNYKKSWDGLQRRGMMQDLSWNKAAEQYEEVLVKAKYQW